MKQFLLVVLGFFVFSDAFQEEECKYSLDVFTEKLLRMDLKIENLEEVKDEMKSLKEEIRGLKEKNSLPVVAFSASNPTTRYPAESQIIFANVDMNEGNGYNASNGAFTAPYAGFYQFSTHFCGASSKHMASAIVYDKKVVALSTTTLSVRPGCASVNAFVNMAAGEKVFVKGTYPDNELAEDRYRRASFLGMLFHI